MIRALLSYCEPNQDVLPFKRVTLVRLTYEQCHSVDPFLLQFFTYLDKFQNSRDNSDLQPSFDRGVTQFVGFSPDSSPTRKQEAMSAVNSFAEYLFRNLFLPMKASGSKTPQTSAANLSGPAVENIAIKREESDVEPKDDDGLPLTGPLTRIEVAHIMPRSIMSTKAGDNNPELSASKKIALSILNMFDPGVVHLI
ncbi:hypothetical protein MGYG_03440 [Nannizzia gypsea CBS 118893]|uniref:HNH nuclease domain-containing protein n=1 Tax=Arthroderma gypseum (strain ATCC MYA-4604 / CBS 118893) TaxID=535722 RepID=E4URW6_ARTGP|nr:hypothetical protein MGYG_03440 [Nannizzia gypsea CBS 118893]EFR00437.1 hypothetical protein MGYG_03440 [Nannizzia gypsea CBS 118893]